MKKHGIAFLLVYRIISAVLGGAIIGGLVATALGAEHVDIGSGASLGALSGLFGLLVFEAVQLRVRWRAWPPKPIEIPQVEHPAINARWMSRKTLFSIASVGAGLAILSVIGVLAVRGDFDRPKFNADEVMAIVKFHLSRDGLIKPLQLSSARLSGEYVGNGKWTGTATTQFVYDRGERMEAKTITWNFYEKSQTTEVVKVRSR